MAFPFQINSLKILPNGTLFMWPENNTPEGATSWRERDGRARWHISFWGKLTSQFCPVIDSIWLRSFSLHCDCHLDSWEAKACNYSQATLLSEPGRALRLFLPWLITGEAGQGGSKERGKSDLSPWERPPQATSTMQKRSEVLGSPLEFSWYEQEEARASCLLQILFSGDRICLEIANEVLGLLWLTGSWDNHYNVIHNTLWAVV